MAKTIIETKRKSAGIGPESRQIASVDLVSQDDTHNTLPKRIRLTALTVVDADDGRPGRGEPVTYRVAAAALGGPPGWTAEDAADFRSLLLRAFDAE